MKTIRSINLARLTIAITAFAGSAGIVIASGTTPDKGVVAKVIQLHAPNNTTQTVTIWTPISQNGGETTPVRNGSAKVIELHAPNGPTQSVTVWTPGTDTKLNLAPLK